MRDSNEAYKLANNLASAITVRDVEKARELLEKLEQRVK